MPAQATSDATKWSKNIAKYIQGWWSFPIGLTEPLYYVKPAGAPHGHVPVAVVGLGRGHRGHPPGPTGTSHTGTYRSAMRCAAAGKLTCLGQLESL